MREAVLTLRAAGLLLDASLALEPSGRVRDKTLMYFSRL
jgi:hypothetical protein